MIQFIFLSLFIHINDSIHGDEEEGRKERRKSRFTRFSPEDETSRGEDYALPPKGCLLLIFMEIFVSRQKLHSTVENIHNAIYCVNVGSEVRIKRMTWCGSYHCDSQMSTGKCDLRDFPRNFRWETILFNFTSSSKKCFLSFSDWIRLFLIQIC